jgi:hypothetical protein
MWFANFFAGFLSSVYANMIRVFCWHVYADNVSDFNRPKEHVVVHVLHKTFKLARSIWFGSDHISHIVSVSK